MAAKGLNNIPERATLMRKTSILFARPQEDAKCSIGCVSEAAHALEPMNYCHLARRLYACVSRYRRLVINQRRQAPCNHWLLWGNNQHFDSTLSRKLGIFSFCRQGAARKTQTTPCNDIDDMTHQSQPMIIFDNSD